MELYQRVGVMGPTHSLTACPIELHEDDGRSSSTELPAPSMASTSLVVRWIDGGIVTRKDIGIPNALDPNEVRSVFDVEGRPLTQSLV